MKLIILNGNNKVITEEFSRYLETVINPNHPAIYLHDLLVDNSGNVHKVFNMSVNPTLDPHVTLYVSIQPKS